MKNRYRVELSYDGTEFHGFALQPGLRTVCGVLSDSLTLALSETPEIVAAARTDTGVHALSQVCHIDMASNPKAEWLLNKIRSLLKSQSDLYIRSVFCANEGFHARFSATGRRYLYLICDKASEWSPQYRRFTHRVNAWLDDDLMRKAALNLVGLRDFGAFCKPKQQATAIRHLRTLDITRNVNGRLSFYFEADAFCHSMVRSMAGALVQVGKKQISIEHLNKIVKEATRTGSIAVLPPQGLSLVGVDYPPSEFLALQEKRSRQKRMLHE